MFTLIGETLRRLRKDKGLTLAELGTAAELGRGQLSRIENGHQEATLSTLAKILNAQGVSRREFFRRYDLVESEAQEVGRQRGAGAAAPAEGDWSREVQEILGRVGSFVNTTLHQPQPVAQGAVEIGELIVFFRVVSKNAGLEPPRTKSAEEPGETPSGPGGATTRRRSAARRKS
jgi:transcriptional regulator with XRE-family HTH domain